MAGLLGMPKPQPLPPPAQLPAVPERSAAEVTEAASRQRERFYGSSRTQTMLTGGDGAAAPSRTTQFLGGGR